jgi:UDP-2-acetamido-3-amino-2,3-dideoxy-glucuronate N-acetyltransferase
LTMAGEQFRFLTLVCGKGPGMISPDVELGEGTIVFHPDQVNLYGCRIGRNCRIGSFVEIRKTVVVGDNVKIQAFAFLPEGVVVEDGVFIGPHTCFTNDRYPRAINPDGSLRGPEDWTTEQTIVRRGASLGANCTIVCGIEIGEFAMVAAGAVVTKSVPPYALVAGVPARVVGDLREREGQ